MVAINPGSLASHKKWSEQSGFAFPICVDTDKKVAIAYGATKSLMGIQRCVILVDQQGIVRWSAEGMPETVQILAELDRLNG